MAALDRDGVARIDEVISPEAAQTLLAHVNTRLEEKRQALEAQDLRAEASFGDVLMRENRCALLRLTGRQALQERHCFTLGLSTRRRLGQPVPTRMLSCSCTAQQLRLL